MTEEDEGMEFKKRMMAAATVLALCAGTAAYGAEAAAGDGPGKGFEVEADIFVAGKPGDWYGPGDLLVLSVSVENCSDNPLSGDLWVVYPDSGCEVVAEPALAHREGAECYAIDGLAPGTKIKAVTVLEAPGSTIRPNWTATANFIDAAGTGNAVASAEAHFGAPDIKCDRDEVIKNGVIKVRNDGNGGASNVTFTFLAKKEWQTQEGLPDGAVYMGEGRIGIGLGGISAGGQIEKDFSGLLHERMSDKHVFEIAYEDWEPRKMPEQNWTDLDD